MPILINYDGDTINDVNAKRLKRITLSISNYENSYSMWWEGHTSFRRNIHSAQANDQNWRNAHNFAHHEHLQSLWT